MNRKYWEGQAGIRPILDPKSACDSRVHEISEYLSKFHMGVSLVTVYQVKSIKAYVVKQKNIELLASGLGGGATHVLKPLFRSKPEK